MKWHDAFWASLKRCHNYLSFVIKRLYQQINFITLKYQTYTLDN